ncbi:MAG: hypothetical protein ACYDDI_00235 [Candidatus Acidiferrales bacterium]
MKLSPLLLAGAFVIPKLRTPLLGAGVAFTDWASSKWLRDWPEGRLLRGTRRRKFVLASLWGSD